MIQNQKHKRTVAFRTDDLVPLTKQIDGYLHASTLILGHGSGMIHILWMKPHSTIIEIIPETPACESEWVYEWL